MGKGKKGRTEGKKGEAKEGERNMGEDGKGEKGKRRWRRGRGKKHPSWGKGCLLMMRGDERS